MKKWIVLNYDLGLKGDYEALYRYLDNKEAKDCGNCNSVFFIDVKDTSFEEVVDFLRKEISENVKINTTDRIYITSTSEEAHDGDNRIKGRFLFGARKRAVWEGYGDITRHEDEDF